MRSIPLVMTWDTLRRGWWLLLGAALGANVLPVMLFGVLQHGGVNPSDKTSVVLHMIVTTINLAMFGVAVVGALGTPARLYTYPIRTSSLVLVQMLLGMVLIAVEAIVSTALLNWAFDLRWPLWGTAIFGAVAFATLLAVWRLFENSGWAIFAMTLAVMIVSWPWLSIHDRVLDADEARIGTPTQIGTVMTPGDLPTLGVMFVLAVGVAVTGVARNRCGQPPFSLGIIAWLARVFSATPQTGMPFRTPAGAQFWFEWQRKGWAMPGTVMTVLVPCLLVWLIVSREAQTLYEGAVVAGVLIPFAGFLSGFLFGQVGSRDSELQKMDQFLATRPVTNAELARAILRCAASSLLIAWAIWAASFLALGAMLRARQVAFPLRLPEPLGWWYLPAMLVGAWAAISLSIPVLLTGRKRLAAATGYGSIGLVLGLMLFAQLALSRQAQDEFFHRALLAAGIALVMGTVWAFNAALKRSLIGAPTIFVAASVWGLLCALVVVYGVSHPMEGVFAYFLAAGILALAVSPLATAPLALAWNRNR